MALFRASGMLLDDSVPMFCGRTELITNSNKCECFGYNQSEWIAIPGPPTCEYYSASAKLIDQVDGKTRFVIAGGDIYKDQFNDVHAYDGKTWQSLPDLPSPVSQHCIVAINDTVLLSIGGRSLEHDEKNKTYFFNSEVNRWFPGPDLITERKSCSCSTVNWKNPSNGDSDKVVVIAGGYNNRIDLDSVELLYMNDISKGWQPGPKMPYAVYHAILVQYKESVVLVGGDGHYDVDRYRIYQLSSPDGTWIEMKQTLPIEVNKPIAFLIPDELIDCEKT